MNRRNQVIKQNISRGKPAPPSSGVRGSGGTSAPVEPVAQNRAVQNKPVTGVAQGRPATAPPQPASPGGPKMNPMPWDVQAANDEAGAIRSRDAKLVGLDAGHLRTQQAYGLEGPWADFASNPYSQAALLQRSYDNAQRGAMTGYAAQGQLYAGSLVNARNANTRGFDIDRDRLQKGYAEEGARYQAARAGAYDEAAEAISNAGWSRIEAGLEQPLEDEAAPAGKKAKKKKPPKKKGR